MSSVTQNLMYPQNIEKYRICFRFLYIILDGLFSI